MTSTKPLLKRITPDDVRDALEATGYTLIQSFCHDASRKEGDPFAVVALAFGADLPRLTCKVDPARKFLGITSDYACGFTRSFDKKPYDQAAASSSAPGSDDGLQGWRDGAAIREQFVTYHPIPNYSPLDT